MGSKVRVEARNEVGDVFRKQSRALLYMAGLNGRLGICGMEAVTLMADPRL